MHRSRVLAIVLGSLVTAVPVVAEGPYVGVDVGYSGPVNGNYRARVKGGGTVNPYVGYLFDWDKIQLGPQGELQFTYQRPDNDNRYYPHEQQWTTLVGYLGGLRVQFPVNEVVRLEDYIPGWDRIELHTDTLFGGFSGLSARINHTAAGFSVGGGLDFYLTENWAIGAYGRYNVSFTSPRPLFVFNQVPEENGTANAQWASAGLALTYRWTEEEAPVVPPPPVPPLVAKKKIVLRNVNFDFDKSTIRPDAVPILDEALRLLKEEGDVVIITKGYTDSIGSAQYNQGLSVRRATAVKQYLVDHGIPAKRITVQGFGEADPVATNATPDGRAQNRRVELHVAP